MNFGLYCIWDDRQKEFAFPMVLKNDQVARRVYLTSVAKWPDFEDEFKLYKIGEYHIDDLGRPVITYPSPVYIEIEE